MATVECSRCCGMSLEIVVNSANLEIRRVTGSDDSRRSVPSDRRSQVVDQRLCFTLGRFSCSTGGRSGQKGYPPAASAMARNRTAARRLCYLNSIVAPDAIPTSPMVIVMAIVVIPIIMAVIPIGIITTVIVIHALDRAKYYAWAGHDGARRSRPAY